MSRSKAKGGKTSEYVGVSHSPSRSGKASAMRYNALYQWMASIIINGHQITKQFETERDAAIQYDKWVLEYRLDRPLNILKPKVAA